MELPQITCSGTGAAALLDQYTAAADALRAALTALEAAAPNARDYGTPQPFYLAAHQHRARVEKLRAVLLELERLQEHCADYV